jgi:hypothetical protein
VDFPQYGYITKLRKKKRKKRKPWFTSGNYFPFVSFPSNRWTLILALKKKNLIYKNQGGEPIHQKYKANESMSGHNQKKKLKANNQPKNKNKRAKLQRHIAPYDQTIVLP